MPDILNLLNVQQKEKQVRTCRRLFQLSHVLEQSSTSDLLPKCGYSELKFPRFNSSRTTALTKNPQEPSVPRNGCPSKGVPLFQWSWPQNVRRPGWKRPLVRLPPLSITTDKTEPVNIGASQSFLQCDRKAASVRAEPGRCIPSNINPEKTRRELKPEVSNKLAEIDTIKPAVKNHLPKIKRKQLVVVIPYIQYDSKDEESEDSVDEEGKHAFNNNINEEKSCYQKKGRNKRLVQEKNERSDKTISNKKSEILRQSSKSSLTTENRMSAQRIRVLVRKSIDETEVRDEHRCYSSEEESFNGEDNKKEKLIVDFSHKVRDQWQRELREILNKSPDYKRDRDTKRENEKSDFRPFKMATVSPPKAINDHVFSLRDSHVKNDNKLSESVKQDCNHLQRLGAGYESGLNQQISLSQESTKFWKRKKNPTAQFEVRMKRNTRKPRHFTEQCDNSQSDSFDFHFFWNLLETSKSQAGAGIKLSPNGSRKNSYSSNPESWAINSPVYKKVFFYKKKRVKNSQVVK